VSLLAPDVRMGGAPRLYADAREREREKARRKRARRRARGLAGNGHALVSLVRQRAQLVRFACPPGCICRDCLFPATEYRPRVARFLGARA